MQVAAAITLKAQMLASQQDSEHAMAVASDKEAAALDLQARVCSLGGCLFEVHWGACVGDML
jgi:hypothetical protein